MLKSLADKAGKSLKDAERYYGDAKKQRMKSTGKKEKGLTGDDYRYIMGVVKKRLKLPTKKVEMKLAESLIDVVLHESPEDFDIRVYRDLDGGVSFATPDDVHIPPGDDSRVALIHRLANDYDWPHNFEFPENIEGYEGSVNDLTRDVLGKVFPGFEEAIDAVKPRGPRKKTLAQKQGARAGGRTRSRRQYTEAQDLEFSTEDAAWKFIDLATRKGFSDYSDAKPKKKGKKYVIPLLKDYSHKASEIKSLARKALGESIQLNERAAGFLTHFYYHDYNR